MHTLHKFSDIDHLLILCNLSGSDVFFIHKTHHVYEWQQTKIRLFLTEKKKNSPKSHKFSVVAALLSRLGWLSSSVLITYNQGLNQDVLQCAVGISVCCAPGPGTLWLLGELGSSRGLRALMDHWFWWTLGLCCGTHTQFWWLFFICF